MRLRVWHHLADLSSLIGALADPLQLLRSLSSKRGSVPVVLTPRSARSDLHGEILSVAGSEVVVCQLIAEIDPLFIRDRLPSSDPVVRFLAHGVAELRLIRFQRMVNGRGYHLRLRWSLEALRKGAVES